MAGTQKTEQIATFSEKFKAVKEQMLDNSKYKKKYTEEEIDVMVKSSLVNYANDKVEFALRGAIRRNLLKKLNRQRELQGLAPMSQSEWETNYKKSQKKQLENLGFSFSLTKEEKAIHDQIVEKGQNAAAEEMTKIASEAMRKILQSVN